MSASGRFLPVVTIRDFSAAASCYAWLNDSDWPGADGHQAPCKARADAQQIQIGSNKEKMSFIALFFFVAGVFLLIFGFKKNNRALLTFAACFWLASGVTSDFAHGFRDGWDSAGQSTPHATAC